jgi:hypothetical protein
VKDNFCDITIVLDRSGSMETVRADTIGGFNQFITAQAALPGACNVSLVQFDNAYEPVYVGRAVQSAPLLDAQTFVPRGGTALLDAIGRTINETGRRLEAMPDEARPSRVLFVILTDGGENASHEFTLDKVFSMIEHQKKAYDWDFAFLGANQDAIKVGARMGIGAGSTMSYAANKVGTQGAFHAASKYAIVTRSGLKASFDEEDRKTQAEAGVK